MSKNCDGCDGTGIRPNSTNHSGVDIPDGWVVVERCDTCEQYEGDLDAAKAYSPSGTTAIIEKPTHNSIQAYCAKMN